MKRAVVVIAVLVGCKDKPKPEAVVVGHDAAIATPDAPPRIPGTGDTKTFSGIGSCSFAADRGMCMEFTATYGGAAAEEQRACEEEGGKWTTVGCPDAMVVGTCTNPAGAGAVIKLYSSKFASPDEAKRALCSDKGDTFVPAPK